MKKLNTIKNSLKALIVVAILVLATSGTAQVKKGFSLRYQSSINGDVIVVGNNTISRTTTGNYNGDSGNHDFSDNVYVDIDNDNSTFNSSSANISNPYPNDTCLGIDKVLLYWAAADKGIEYGSYETDNQPEWDYNQVKLMLPGQSNYTTITADEVIFRGRDENPHFVNDAYICVKDITSEVLNNSNSFGKYQVANVEGREGYLYSHDGGNIGTSGGWQIVLVYKTDNLTRKNISLFDGYANVTSVDNNFDINFSGFQTVPNGAVKSDLLIGALEGDRDLSGDKLQILNSSNNFVDLDAPLRPSYNFFNSRITVGNSDFIDRNPSSLNTLGFDSAIFSLDNPGNTLLHNNQTSITLRLTSNQESFGLYLLGLSVEVYEPKLDPIFYTATPNNIIPNGSPQTITYNVSTSNTGNDDATNVSFVTTVPLGSELVQPILGLPSGVTYNYNNSNRQLTFYVDNGLLDLGETLNLSFDTTVNDQCYYLENSCLTSLNSQLTATYSGTINQSTFNTLSSNNVDTCGQANYQNTTVTINSPAPATWLTALNELDRTIECNDASALSNAQSLTPNASCSNLIPVKNSGSFISDSSCSSNGTITNTWSFTDACGNTIENYTQTITIIDTSPPTFTAPDDIEIFTNNDCNYDVSVSITGDVTDENDNCSSNLEATYSDLVTNGTCEGSYIITRTWSLADDCGNTATDQVQTITVTDNTAPDLTACDIKASTIECNGSNNENLALDWNAENIIDIETCAQDNCSANVTVTSDFDFNNFVSTCGAGGTITVNYTISDDCGNSSSVAATLTIEDTTAPDLTLCTDVADETIECDGANNSTLASDWNATNIAALATCPTDSCDSDNTFTVTSDFDFNNFVSTCGAGGTITVNYTVSDDCGNNSSVAATLTIEDTTAPDLTLCTDVADETIECDGANNSTLASDWNAANIAALATCPTDSCDSDNSFTVTSDFDFNNFVSTCGAGGTITVNYTVNDDCGNSSSVAATLTIEDTTAPDLIACTDVADETIECDGANNNTLASDWNAANIAALATCPTDSCDSDNSFTVTSDFDFNNFVSTCGAGGTITVNYTVSDDCGNSSSVAATLTIEDTTAPNLTLCTDVADETIECDGVNNSTLASDWNAANIAALATCPTDSCDSDNSFTVTSDFDFNNFVSTCGAGGTITVNYTVNDDCGNSSSVAATLTIEDTTAPDLTLCTDVADETIECDGANNSTLASDWNATNIAALATCPTDSCDTDNTFTVTSDFDFNNFVSTCGAGGTITVNYTVSDDCGNSSSVAATLTIEDTTAPDLTLCTDVADETIECDGANNSTLASDWNAANIAALATCPTDSCDSDNTFTVTSDFDFNNFVSTCGAGGTITVNYTVSDDCGNSSSVAATLTIEDTTAPDLTLCTDVADETIECDGANNSTLASDWNATNIAALATCPTDSCDSDSTFTVTSDFDFNNFVSTCGAGGTITVNYTISDDCGNNSSVAATLTIEDTTAPDLTLCTDVADETIECDGANNSTLASDWNAANIAALATCPTDSCDSDNSFTVTSDFDFNNFVSTCGAGGTITVNYTISDDCGNSSSVAATLTIEDTVGPILTTPLDLPTDVICSNIPEVPELIFEDNCSTQDVIISFEETSTYTGNEEMYTITWIWTALDDCGNETVITHNIDVITENFIEESFITRCFEDGEIDLYDELPFEYDTNMEWVVETDGISIVNGIFDPLNVELGDYVFTYTTSDNGCLKTFKLTVNINEDCVVLPCGLDRIKISKAVTPNGDGYNETFNVTGAADCGYIVEVKLFNRFGDVVYESDDYQNDWSGISPTSSIGSAGRLPNGTYYYVVVLKESGLDPIAGPLYLGTK